MAVDDIPDVIAADAPTPETAASGAVRTTYTTDDGATLVAADCDGGRYCIECASEAYIERAHDDPRTIAFGGVVPEGAAVDCPGSTCGHCLRRIRGFTVLHYDGACQPATCPRMETRDQ